jgi:hypothetical protein
LEHPAVSELTKEMIDARMTRAEKTAYSPKLAARPALAIRSAKDRNGGRSEAMTIRHGSHTGGKSL